MLIVHAGVQRGCDIVQMMRHARLDDVEASNKKEAEVETRSPENKTPHKNEIKVLDSQRFRLKQNYLGSSR